MSETKTAVAGGSGTAGRRAARRQEREAQIEARQRLARRERWRRRMLWGAGIGAGIVALGLLVFWLMTPVLNSGRTVGGVQSFLIQGQIHIARGQTHPPYNSTPPTSGWHYGDAVAPPGVSAQPIPDEVQVHNLEHGEIVIQYDCAEGCPDTISALERIVRSYPKKVVLAPRPGMSAVVGRPIALTAWGKLAYLDTADETFIRRFIADRKDKGPEVFPD
jgi:hypothetical protein